ncbi:MAG TPA: hypothetical protein VF306_16200 [Pirellulales bacterium]
MVRCPRSSVSLLSEAIVAEAALLRASGDLLVSAAIARNLHAEAASKEMDNSVKWVSTYFERRRLNRDARAAANPGYLQRELKQQEQYRLLIDKNLPAGGGELSEELNYMLRGLLANTSYSDFSSDHPHSFITSADNVPLSAEERHQIRVTEGKLSGGKALVFRVDTAEVLETRWPPALRVERFDPARKAFEDARDWAIGDLRVEKKVTRSNQKRLMAAVDRLATELQAAYPPNYRKNLPPRDLMAYLAAERFLRSLAVSTYRLVEAQSSLAFDQSFRFQGKSVGELLQHVVSKGLEFAPAEPGGEATYRKVYYGVRAFYERVVPKPTTDE